MSGPDVMTCVFHPTAAKFSRPLALIVVARCKVALVDPRCQDVLQAIAIEVMPLDLMVESAGLPWGDASEPSIGVCEEMLPSDLSGTKKPSRMTT